MVNPNSMVIPVLHASLFLGGSAGRLPRFAGTDLFFPYFLTSLSHYFRRINPKPNRRSAPPPMEIVIALVQEMLPARPSPSQSFSRQFSGITPREIAVDSS